MKTRILALVLVGLLYVVPSGEVRAQASPGGKVEEKVAPPPRTIADIVAILDQEKPNPAKRQALLDAADAPEPPDMDPRKKYEFYYKRAQARSILGRSEDMAADLQVAIPLGIATGAPDESRLRTQLAQYHRANGNPNEALRILNEVAAEIEKSKGQGRLFAIYSGIALMHIGLGRFEEGEKYIGYQNSLMQELLSNPRANNNMFQSSWQSAVDGLKGSMAKARGRKDDAIRYFQASVTNARDMVDKSKHWTGFSRQPEGAMEQQRDLVILRLGEAKLDAGRLVEAEVDVREALLSTLRRNGKYHEVTATMVVVLARVMLEQGRLKEAEKLVNAALEILTEMGMKPESPQVVQAKFDLAAVYSWQRRWTEAAQTFRDATTAAGGRRYLQAAVARYPGRILAYAYAGYKAEAVEIATSLFEKNVGRVGPKHYDTALAQALLGVAQSAAGDDAAAIKSFREAIPILLSASRQADTEEASSAVNDMLVQDIVEAYIVTLAKAQQGAAAAGIDAGVESFRLADAARGRSVQRALSASAARSAVRDPALAELVRQEQDQQKAIAAQFGTLSSMLALPPDQRDDKLVLRLRTDVDKLRDQRAKTRQDIERRFPEYASLIDPRPPSVDDLRQVLRSGEALVSFYLARENSFVWVVQKDGPVAFAAAPVGAEELEKKITVLRRALEPQAETLGDIPPFDLELAHELYRLLLQPVEAGWKSAKSLYVVTNGALGLLPLSLLPVEPAKVDFAAAPLFGGYSQVKWLARTHAVTQLPSSAALKTLRGLPKGGPSRQPLIGFGDPFFNSQQASEADEGEVKIASADPVAVRGAKLKRRNAPQTSGIDSAELAQLPRLPDTSAELQSVAAAMRSDPAKSLYLGRQANETIVKKANLSGFRVVAFATHGLVPGEINGLTQPALALTSPQVASVEGDGLLTMDEILGLKLDADWVVLSACNTGAGAGAGAEAASGLGRAFFYAGTRALLLTNWSVHSASARDLVTDLFRRQADNAALSRAEALRQAMVALLDGPGYQEDGKSLFSYAHPIFWAPYSLMGDGG